MSDEDKSQEQAREAGDGEGSQAALDPQTLHAELEETRARAEENYERLLRLQAEMDNLRKRTARELENAHKYGLEKFIAELLPVRDSMEMGVRAAREEGAEIGKIREGMELTLKMLDTVLEKFGVEEIDPQGQRFDPEWHQAMSTQPAPEVEPNTVLTVVQKGYRLNDRLVRPALVIVSTGGKAKAKEAPAGAGEEQAPGGGIDEQA